MSDAQAPPQVPADGVHQVEQGKAEEAPGFKVFAGNLSYATTEDGLKTFFTPVANDIISVQIIMRGTRSAGYGFVAVSTAEAAQQAVDALDKQELDGRPVIIEIAKPSDQKDQEKKEKKAKRRPGRRGSKAVPGEVTEAEANGEAPKAEPTAEGDDASKPKKKKKKSSRKPKKAAPVEGEVAGETAPAPLADGEKPAERQPRVKKPRVARPARAEGEAPSGEPSKNMLFVANLGFNVDDAALEALFTEAGIKVISARIVRRRWGKPRKSKGYGFVDVGDEDEQKKAIAALEGKEVGGRAIAVKIAVNTPHEDEATEAPVPDGAAAAETTAT